MSPVKPYTIVLEARQQDGSQCVCELTLTPIGSLNTLMEPLWIRLCNSLEEGGFVMNREGDRASLLVRPPRER